LKSNKKESLFDNLAVKEPDYGTRELKSTQCSGNINFFYNFSNIVYFNIDPLTHNTLSVPSTYEYHT